MGIKATVDRIEGSQAVMLLRSDESVKFNLPIQFLPGLKEGDIIDINITRDQTETNEAKERVTALIEKLKKKNQ